MRFYLLFFLFIFTSSNFYAQEVDSIIVGQEVKYDDQTLLEPVVFDEERIASYKNDDDFNYIEKNTELSWWQRFKNWLSNLWRRFIFWLVGDYSPGGLVAFLVKVAPYVIITAILGFIVWLFIKLNPAMNLTKKAKTPDVILSEEEKIITQENIPSLIKEALKNNDYRLAVRYYYLLILKELKEKEIIDYQFQKTNHEYIVEISTEKLRENFDQITRLYDFIWYGNFSVSKEDYALAKQAFESMQKNIKQQANE
ncbi:DUF4129 domain-containing protein [Mesonia aquimarina]|uniref:DUF4129 domain-containing protein n=1 Tax=Mesonia aquimarina TaxID=1504967 RepID=UPI000EF5FA25|nr:DUF4129 domain-containing protein [Mesonia aquimarina]